MRYEKALFVTMMIVLGVLFLSACKKSDMGELEVTQSYDYRLFDLLDKNDNNGICWGGYGPYYYDPEKAHKPFESVRLYGKVWKKVYRPDGKLCALIHTPPGGRSANVEYLYPPNDSNDIPYPYALYHGKIFNPQYTVFTSSVDLKDGISIPENTSHVFRITMGDGPAQQITLGGDSAALITPAALCAAINTVIVDSCYAFGNGSIKIKNNNPGSIVLSNVTGDAINKFLVDPTFETVTDSYHVLPNAVKLPSPATVTITIDHHVFDVAHGNAVVFPSDRILDRDQIVAFLKEQLAVPFAVFPYISVGSNDYATDIKPGEPGYQMGLAFLPHDWEEFPDKLTLFRSYLTMAAALLAPEGNGNGYSAVEAIISVMDTFFCAINPTNDQLKALVHTRGIMATTYDHDTQAWNVATVPVTTEGTLVFDDPTRYWDDPNWVGDLYRIAGQYQPIINALALALDKGVTLTYDEGDGTITQFNTGDYLRDTSVYLNAMLQADGLMEYVLEVVDTTDTFSRIFNELYAFFGEQLFKNPDSSLWMDVATLMGGQVQVLTRNRGVSRDKQYFGFQYNGD